MKQELSGMPVAEVVDDYFDYLNDSRHRLAVDVDGYAGQALANGNSAFHAENVAHAACVPADIAREDMLEATLDQISLCAGRAALPTAALVSANYSEYVLPGQERTIAHNLATIRQFQAAHPGLPFSYYVTTTSRGTLLTDIKEGVMGASLRSQQQLAGGQGRPLRNVILSSWDADTLHANEHYFDRLQHAHAAATTSAWMGFQPVRHDRLDNDRFPDANRLLGWFDLLTIGQTLHPQHFSADAMAFAVARGIGGVSINEQSALLGRAQRQAGPGNFSMTYLPYTRLVISARRLASKMAQGTQLMYHGLSSTSEENTHNSDITTLSEDVDPAYFNATLSRIVPKLLQCALPNCKSRELDKNPTAPEMVAYASSVARTAARTFGGVHNTTEIVESAIAVLRGAYNL
jgi:hypothetical protein